jgi:hypothetical protein
LALIPPGDLSLVERLLASTPAAASSPPLAISEEELGPQESFFSPVLYRDPQEGLRGRLVTLDRDEVFSAPGMEVFAVRGGAVLAQSRSDARGVFSFPSDAVSPGYLSVIARGPSGALAVSVEVQEDELAFRPETIDGAQPVAVASSQIPYLSVAQDEGFLGILTRAASTGGGQADSKGASSSDSSQISTNAAAASRSDRTTRSVSPRSSTRSGSLNLRDLIPNVGRGKGDIDTGSGRRVGSGKDSVFEVQRGRISGPGP